MKKNENISMSVIRRLPRYYRFLSYLDKQEVERASSGKLAEIMNVTASQVRQDLNCFGGFGQQGYGYSVKQLKNEIGNILGLNISHDIILIGAGNLGHAVATHMDFESKGFNLIAAFDKDEELVHKTLRNTVEIYHSDLLEQFCGKHQIDAAILCIPQSAVGPVVQILYDKGVKNFWNFSHYDITNEYEDVIVENVHLSDSLMTLCYRMNQRQI